MSHKKRRILLVDDDPNVSYLLSMIMKLNDFDVMPFTDPDAALAVFGKDQYDLLLLDVEMPKMNGFELYREMKKIDKQVRVCFIANYMQEHVQEFRESFPELGSDNLAEKPTFANDLLKILQAHLGSW